jgi:hypothetical protein
MSVAYVAAYEEGGNSTPMVVANCDGDPGEEWSPYTDGTVRVQGGCLDVVSAGTTSGTDVDWYPCNGTAAQDWTAESNGELVNPNSGLCLTVPGGNTSSRLDIETCTDATDQQWKLPTGTSSTGSGSTITAANYAAASSGVATQPTSRRGRRRQRWLARQRKLALTATPFATIDVNGTGGWQTWTSSTPVTASPVPSGNQTLYVTFTTSTGGNFVNVNWFQFT